MIYVAPPKKIDYSYALISIKVDQTQLSFSHTECDRDRWTRLHWRQFKLNVNYNHISQQIIIQYILQNHPYIHSSLYSAVIITNIQIGINIYHI